MQGSHSTPHGRVARSLRAASRAIIENLEGRALFTVDPLGSQIVAGPLQASGDMVVFSDVTGGGSSTTQKLTLTNVGSSAITFGSDVLSISGSDASKFKITNS